MKSTRYCLLLLLFITELSFAQNDEFNELFPDSALIWLNNNYVDNPDNFHKRALQTLAQAYEQNDDQLKGESHHLLMRWHAYHVLFTMDSVYLHSEKAIVLFKLTNDQANLAATSSELAFEYIDENDLKRSEELIFNAIAIYENLGDKKGLGEAYHRLSSICLYQKSTDLSIKYDLEALELTEQIKDHYNSSLAWLALELAYYEAGELEKAIHAADKCIETIKTFDIDDEPTLARAYGYRGDVWAELKEYQKSLEDNLKSYAIIEAEIGAARPATKTYRSGIGLITNELITNSLKHAIPNKRKGQILITLVQEKNGLLKLNIADNGDATVNESIVKKEKDFGTLLIQLLTIQLGGKLEKSTEEGTSTMIQFPLQQKSVA